MSQASSEETVVAQGAMSAELLLYDYFKHLTTLSLVALGGVLSLSQAGVTIDQRRLMLIVSLVGGGGITALTGLDAIVKAKVAGRTMPGLLKWLRGLSIMLLGLGTGAFAAAFLDGVK